MKLFYLSLVLGGLLPLLVVAQTKPSAALPVPGVGQGSPATLEYQPALSGYSGGLVVDPNDPGIKLLHLREALQTTEGEEAREKITGEVKNLLNQLFDKDLEARRLEMENMKVRAEKSKKKLDKREASKESLIKLQLSAYVYEAEGLDLNTGMMGLQVMNVNTGVLSNFGPAATLLQQDGSPAVYLPQATSNALNFQAIGSPIEPSEKEKLLLEIQGLQAQLKLLKSGEKTEKTEEAIVKELQDLLGQYFDIDLESRRESIKEIEKGMSKLTALIEKRAKAKEAIVELQLTIVVNEADGLGFFSTPEGAGSNGLMVLPISGSGLGLPPTVPSLPTQRR